MKQGLLYLLKYYLFWLIYFQIARLIFVLVNIGELKATGFSSVLPAFFYGLKMDASAAGYIMLIPIALFILLGIFNVHWKKIFAVYTSVLLAIVSIVVVADARLYTAWGYRMDLTPLLYLKTPGEAMASFEWFDFTLYPLLIAGLFILGYKLFMKRFQLKKKLYGSYKNILLGPLFCAIIFIPVRGGVGLAPMNIGSVYFSSQIFANHVAVNELWHLIYNLVHPTKHDGYHYMDDAIAELKVKQANKGSHTIPVLKTEPPNIVLVVLESFTSKIIDLEYEGVEVAPHLNRLKQEGIYFDNLYAAGERSDKGMVAIYSGFPAQPKTSIIDFPQRTQLLPSLFKSVAVKGYNSAYFYGGNIDFASFRSYFLQMGVDQLLSDEDYPNQEQNSKWGIHDHLMMDIFMDSIKAAEPPFLYSLFTLSSHEPYEVPVDPVIPGDNSEARFLNSVHYTDASLGNFVDSLKNSSLWDSTLLIILADHGHKYPFRSKHLIPEKFRVPMLWLGGALDTSFVYHGLASQLDLAPSLLSQLQIDASGFSFGKNLLDSTVNNYAYYVFNNGFACNVDSTFEIVNFNAKKEGEVHNTTPLELGKAILQETFKGW